MFGQNIRSLKREDFTDTTLSHNRIKPFVRVAIFVFYKPRKPKVRLDKVWNLCIRTFPAHEVSCFTAVDVVHTTMTVDKDGSIVGFFKSFGIKVRVFPENQVPVIFKLS